MGGGSADLLPLLVDVLAVNDGLGCVINGDLTDPNEAMPIFGEPSNN